jgi:hypothetical protein
VLVPRKSWLLFILCLVALTVHHPATNPPRSLWNEELAKLRKQVDAMPSDFEKTTFLRQYVGGLIDIGRPDDRAKRIYQLVNFDNFDTAEFYPRFLNHSLAAECGVTTFFYIKLLHAFGFRAYQYSFGFTDEPYARFVHSVALVKINVRGTDRLIVQDPYLDLTYRDLNGDPIDFFDFLASLKRKDFRRIVMDASSVATSLQIPDPSAYHSLLSNSCWASMVAALRRGDGSLRTRIPIVRSYSNLMQSTCGNFEILFVEAMRKHGLQEPFHYSYMLRASELVGSPDHAEIQERIDAVRRGPPLGYVASRRARGE